MERWTFTHKVVAGFAAVVALAVVMAVVGVWALRSVVSSKDRVITVHAQNVADAERLHALSAEKGGRVVQPPRDLPLVGRFSVLASPDGARFAVIRPGG